MHCIYIVLKKVSEPCYPPSLFGNGLLDVVQKGSHPGRSWKLQLYPSNLAYSTVVMWWKVLGEGINDGFVECVGLGGGLWVDDELLELMT